jgi:hypothetical protein
VMPGDPFHELFAGHLNRVVDDDHARLILP